MIPGTKKRAFNFHDLMMFVAIGRKHVRMMALLLGLSLMGGMLVYVYSRPVYYSKAEVRIDYLVRPIDTQAVFKDSGPGKIMRAMNEQQMVERTARRLGVVASYNTIKSRYLKKTAIRPNPEKTAFIIEVWPYLHSWSERYAQALVAEFLQYREEQRFAHIDTVTQTYKRDIEEMELRLDKQLGGKFDYRDEKEITRALIEMGSIRDVPSELIATQKRIREVEYTLSRLEDPVLDAVAKLALISKAEEDKENRVNVGQVVASTPAPGGESNQASPTSSSPGVVVVPSVVKSIDPWQSLEKEKRRIEEEKRAAGSTYLPGHPKMRAIQKELDDVNTKLELEYAGARDRFDLEYQELINTQRDLESKLPEYQSLLRKKEKLEQDYKLYLAARINYKTRIANAQKMIETLDVIQDKERVNLTYLGIRDIRDIDNPVSPSRGKLALSSLILGLALAIGVPLLIESSRSRPASRSAASASCPNLKSATRTAASCSTPTSATSATSSKTSASSAPTSSPWDRSPAPRTSPWSPAARRARARPSSRQTSPSHLPRPARARSS
jgi:hypothetical protein